MGRSARKWRGWDGIRVGGRGLGSPRRVEHFLSRAGQSPPRRWSELTEGPSLRGTEGIERVTRTSEWPGAGRGGAEARSRRRARFPPPGAPGVGPRSAPGALRAPRSRLQSGPRPALASSQPLSGTSSPPRLIKGLLSPPLKERHNPCGHLV